MNRDELLALAERVEALTGPDREVDAEIALAVYGGEIVWLQTNYTMEVYPARKYASAAHVGGFGKAPVYPVTASLDAAMSLVPEGWTALELLGPIDDGQLWAAHFTLADGQGVSGFGASKELAVVCAALRALAAQQPSGAMTGE